MGSNIRKFKCLVHYNGMNRGSILHEDLTYSMLHEMVMKKFNLEANYPLYLSAKLSSIDDNFDITDDKVQFWRTIKKTPFYIIALNQTTLGIPSEPSNNITNTSFNNNGLDLNFGTSEFHNNESNHQNESLFEKQECSFAFGDYHEYEDEKNEFDDVVDDNPLPNYQKWQKYMSSFKPDIPETPIYKSKPMISKHYKKETDVKVGQIFENKEALDLAIRLKALDKGYRFDDRSSPERLCIECLYFKEWETGPCWSWWMAVLKECIGDNPSLLFISDRHAAIALAVQNEFPLAYHAAYTTEEFSSSMSHLQDIQPDAYDKLCQLGPQRWSRAHCPLVRYNYLTSNSVESVNACTVVYRKLPVLKLAETYRAMVQEWQLHVKWQLSGLPCGHVIAVTKYLGLTDCLQFVSDWFKKPKYQGTYAEPIHFIGNVQEWEFSQHIRKAIPPRMDNPQPGRPKNTKQIKSQGQRKGDIISGTTT
ncbi:hypothetical protein Tco_1265668 [Tanacetum coccineum]